MRLLSPETMKIHAPPAAEQRTFEPGTVIFDEGAKGEHAFIVNSGLVEIYKAGPHGEAVIGYVGAGEIFGEMALIDGQPRMAGARAVRGTTCSVVSADLLQKKLEDTDPFVRDILGVLVNGVRSMAKDLLRDSRGLEDPCRRHSHFQGQHHSLNV